MDKVVQETKRSTYPKYCVELYGCTICGLVRAKWNVSAGAKTLYSQVKNG